MSNALDQDRTFKHFQEHTFESDPCITPQFRVCPASTARLTRLRIFGCLVNLFQAVFLFQWGIQSPPQSCISMNSGQVHSKMKGPDAFKFGLFHLWRTAFGHVRQLHPPVAPHPRDPSRLADGPWFDGPWVVSTPQQDGGDDPIRSLRSKTCGFERFPKTSPFFWIPCGPLRMSKISGWTGSSNTHLVDDSNEKNNQSQWVKKHPE